MIGKVCELKDVPAPGKNLQFNHICRKKTGVPERDFKLQKLILIRSAIERVCIDKPGKRSVSHLFLQGKKCFFLRCSITDRERCIRHGYAAGSIEISCAEKGTDQKNQKGYRKRFQ